MTPSTLAAAARAVRDGTVSPLELVETALARAARHDGLNAMAHVDADGALLTARGCADDLRRGHLQGPLHGIPVTVKDLFAVDGLPLRAGSTAPLPSLGPGDAEAVARLRAAGAIVLGTTNLHEVALGITGENPWTGDVRNPWHREHQAGGSSSGAAAAVAAGIGWAALGSDTAGSIRIPASHCGVVGFKPTWGAVSMTGALPLCPTCDHAGPLAPTVEDAAIVFGALSGRPVHVPSPDGRPAPVLGVPVGDLDGWLSVDVRRAWRGLVADLVAADAHVVELVLPDLERASSVYAPLLRAEAAEVHRRALRSDPTRFSEPVREILLEGLELRAVDYVAARRSRRRLLDDLGAALRTVDALVLPATPVPAPRRGSTEVVLESGPAPLRTAFLRLTVLFSLTGVPVVTVPYGQLDGLPIGVQVVGHPARDVSLLGTARWVESAVEHRLRQSPSTTSPGTTVSATRQQYQATTDR